MYSATQKRQALELYDQFKSITKVILLLGYPCRQALYLWISQRNDPPKHKSAFRGKNTPEHPRHPPVEVKLAALHRKYIQKGAVALMNTGDDPRGILPKGEV